MAATTRLLKLLSLLQVGRDWPGSRLAQRLGTSDRTVRRDIERLREIGYNVLAAKGPDGGYRLDSGGELPPLLFDDDQAVAVALALRTTHPLGADLEEAATRALVTIRQVMPSRLRHRIDSLEVTHVARAGETPATGTAIDALTTISDAIRARETLRFDYLERGHSGREDLDTPVRRTEPVHLVASRGRWYLLGWDLDREAWRLYAVDRIRLRVPNGPRFTTRVVPGGDVNEFVSARFKGSNTSEWPCVGTVILDLPARKVLPFAGDGTVIEVAADRCALEVGSWSWGSLAASFGRFEAPMEVVGSPELSAAFEELAARYLATSRASSA